MILKLLNYDLNCYIISITDNSQYQKNIYDANNKNR